ncbi:hypothetical protein EPA93_25845 [Ktedonosporobacter rubrisoli]|uniref:Uncharacterized protein n=1 Tax=Ktedonosporobacter rubrisoli TaxID=2509675 RepID=A0A4P6JUA3_KTERU|nr:DUF5522 domain-containing protein [Ktedonosporobacter rubrisoli]QBD79218.1 hypothetical protein EPA93_25845 [Ktedonosporobacter rubrisoli]
MSLEAEEDWEVTADGLYIATRGFLERRGYCCGNRCRNCPYVNWRNQPTWKPVDPAYVHYTRVSSRSVAGAQAMLHHHERELAQCSSRKKGYHQAMIKHYTLLLERWGQKKYGEDR